MGKNRKKKEENMASEPSEIIVSEPAESMAPASDKVQDVIEKEYTYLIQEK